MAEAAAEGQAIGFRRRLQETGGQELGLELRSMDVVLAGGPRQSRKRGTEEGT
jgi:predicted lipid carrier protein YhbT